MKCFKVLACLILVLSCSILSADCLDAGSVETKALCELKEFFQSSISERITPKTQSVLPFWFAAILLHDYESAQELFKELSSKHQPEIISNILFVWKKLKPGTDFDTILQKTIEMTPVEKRYNFIHLYEPVNSLEDALELLKDVEGEEFLRNIFSALLSLELSRLNPEKGRFFYESMPISADFSDTSPGSEVTKLVELIIDENKTGFVDIIMSEEHHFEKLVDSIKIIFHVASQLLDKQLNTRISNYIYSSIKPFFEKNDLSLNQRKKLFVLMSIITEYLSDFPNSQFNTIQKKLWSRDFLPATMGVEFAAAFRTMQKLKDEHKELALSIYKDSCKTILSWPGARKYYHIIGTLSAEAARFDLESALMIADQVKTLEWHINALRGIYRKHGESKPDLVIKLESFVDAFADAPIHVALEADVKLEAFIGVARTQPEKSLQLMYSLPNQLSRHVYGMCMIAPSLASVNRKKALKILTDESKPFQHEAANAIAWILIDKYLDLILSDIDFFPDAFMPVNSWPGPYLSQPLRFSIDEPSSDE